MVAVSRTWLLLGGLLLASSSAPKRRVIVPNSIQSRDEDLDVSGDVELEKWLDALERAPAAKLCPESCSQPEWSVFPDPASLAACNETMLLNVVVRNEADQGQDTSLGIRACAADYSSGQKPVFTPDDEKAALCSTPNHVLVDVPVRMSSHPGAQSDESFSAGHLLAAGRQVSYHLATKKPSCTNNVLSFGYSQSALIGLYAGAEVHQHGISTEMLSKFLQHVEDQSVSKTTILQVCEVDGVGADYGVGIVAGSTKDFALVQETMRTWADGRCVPDATDQEDWMTVTLRVPKIETRSNSTDVAAFGDDSSPARLSSRSARLSVLEPRAECRYIKVISGDGCWALADRCKISQADLTKYNTRSNFCNTLVVGEPVCCSSGTLPETIPAGNSDGTCKRREVISGDDCPSLASKCGLTPNDFMKVNTKTNLCSTLVVGQPVCCTRGNMPDLKPKPKDNGYCFDYTIQADDNCSLIAARRTLTVANLESFNKNTWGWNGCQQPLFPNTKICLSTGSPPMPAQDPIGEAKAFPLTMRYMR
jgi:hypothetical protein